jgi:hypothetical protein
VTVSQVTVGAAIPRATIVSALIAGAYIEAGRPSIVLRWQQNILTAGANDGNDRNQYS